MRDGQLQQQAALKLRSSANSAALSVSPVMPPQTHAHTHETHRLMSAPATQLVATVAGAEPGGASTIKGLRGVREVRRLKGVVRGVLVELPGTFHRGDSIAALRAMEGVADVEEEGVVTVQIASGGCLLCVFWGCGWGERRCVRWRAC